MANETNTTTLPVNRTYKSTLFIMLFQDKNNLLELYNAVSGKHYTDPEILEINTLENAIYMTVKNDVSFLIDGHLSLYEHQSTYNPNLPLRFLIYISKLYSRMTRNENLYGTKMIRIPPPEFLIFYNGKENLPDRTPLNLSDMYYKTEDPDSRAGLELTAVMLNISGKHNRKLKEACRTLREYAIYTDKVREYAEEMDLADAVERAIRECIAEGVLKDFLEKHRAEAKEMSIFEYDQEKHMRQEREDAWEDARLSMIKKMLENGMSEEDISHIAGVSEEEIERAKNPGLIRTANGMSIFEYDQEKHMRQEREEAWADGHSAGITEGRAENQRLTARNLQQMNMPPEQIARAVGADIDTVRKWLSDS
ncbi:MAG TPA: hypothetical protein H9713_02850 [Candidatus Mediterraneibacter surreyensis]|nr:hypothetical protein [Candidatus Mediterraneibacter surreyensis]